jgi:outer membrane protein OmpA-like peptidoglycan-associated protein
MKKILLAAIGAGLALGSMAQELSYKKSPSLGINFFLQDMKTARLLETKSLSSVLSNGNWTKIKDMDPGLSIQYFEGLNEHVDFMGTLNGSFVTYPFYWKSGVATPTNSKFLLETDANLNLKLLSDKYFFVPYLRLGVGASMYSGTYFAAYAPAGIGFQFNLGEGTFVHLQGTYKAAVTALAVNYMSYSIGIASPITERKQAALVTPPPPPVADKDTDGDGIPDSKDKCPTVPGVAKYEGCPVPDTDGDGINDENDKCPTVKGVAKYDGCPVPDTDGDGINDEEDKCPTIPGVARYQGCPVPDRDHDGVNDEEDRCPDVPGVKENFGCPVVRKEVLEKVQKNARNILFFTGSDKITVRSIKELNEVAAIMKADPALKMDIEGHTDNIGKDASNQVLSDKRAKAIYKYLANKGVEASRLSAQGFGAGKPVADNKTVAGRAQNRRVELKLKY